MIVFGGGLSSGINDVAFSIIACDSGMLFMPADTAVYRQTLHNAHRNIKITFHAILSYSILYFRRTHLFSKHALAN